MSLVHRAWIPYPQPPPSVELRSGVLYSGCHCLKRDGLQYDCPRRGCQGRAPCLASPVPLCAPSGNAPPKVSSSRAMRDNTHFVKDAKQHDQHDFQRQHAKTGADDEKFVRMGREGYFENPPVKYRRPPCREHRKSRT